MPNALPILLIGGAAALMLAGKKERAPKSLSGNEGKLTINGERAVWILEPSVGGTETRWIWGTYKEDGGGHLISADGEFSTADEARRDLLKTGISKGWKFK